MLKNIFFDLDGTLTDPQKGILRSIHYALQKMGHEAPPTQQLLWCIGPPLREVFRQLLQTEDQALVEQAVAFYRERYSTVGMFENKPYNGIEAALSRLQSAGFQLFVSTSKPRVYAKQILEHFGLAHHFIAIHGPELDGTHNDKAELMRHILIQHELSPRATAVVGDRMHDILAAQKNALTSIAVSYGYGSLEELQDAQPTYICNNLEELVSRIFNFSDPKHNTSHGQGVQHVHDFFADKAKSPC
ncbi:MAG: HAD hydrolase-like protein [bacterium]